MAVIGAVNVMFNAVTTGLDKGFTALTRTMKNTDNIVDALQGKGRSATGTIKDIGELLNKVGDAASAADKALIEGKSGWEATYEAAKTLPVIGEFASGLEKIGRVATGLDRHIAAMEWGTKIQQMALDAKEALQKLEKQALQTSQSTATAFQDSIRQSMLAGNPDAQAKQAIVDTAKNKATEINRTIDEQIKTAKKQAADAMDAINKAKMSKRDYDNPEYDQRTKVITANVVRLEQTLETERKRLLILNAQDEAWKKQAIWQAKAAEDAKKEREEKEAAQKKITDNLKDMREQLNQQGMPDWIIKLNEFTKNNPGMTFMQGQEAQYLFHALDKVEKAKGITDIFVKLNDSIRDTMAGEDAPLLQTLKELEKLGGSQQQMELARKLFADLKDANAFQAGEQAIKALNQQLDDLEAARLGLAPEIAKMIQGNATDAQLEEANRVLAQIKNINTELDRRNSLEQMAKGILEAQQTPLDKYEQKVKDIEEMQNRGLLTQKQADKERLAAEKDFNKQLGGGELIKNAGLLERRFTFDLPGQEFMKPQIDLKKVQENQLKVQIEQKEIQKKQLQQMEQGGVVLFNGGLA